MICKAISLAVQQKSTAPIEGAKSTKTMPSLLMGNTIAMIVYFGAIIATSIASEKGQE